MIFYLDTSVLISAMTQEAVSERVRAWLGKRAAGALLTSDWVHAEFSAALSIKMRTGEINADKRTAAQAGFQEFCYQSVAIAEVERAHFQAAARYADQYALGLRAGDALHLAIANDRRARLATLDKRPTAAAEVLGLGAILL